MRKWVWIERSVILAAHDEQLAEHGGSSGIRDAGLLDSALARPLNRAAYGKPDTAELAAAYAYGLATNHPFVDGNKRVAFIALELFLALNGHRLVIDDVNCAMCMLAVAAGTMKETALADWTRRHSKRRNSSAVECLEPRISIQRKNEEVARRLEVVEFLRMDVPPARLHGEILLWPYRVADRGTLERRTDIEAP